MLSTAAYMFGVPPIFAFGEGLAIYVTVILLISIVAFVTSSLIVLLWAVLSRLLIRVQLGRRSAFVAVLIGTLGRVLYMFLYDERVGIWLLPALAGASVMTNATLVVFSLIRIDGEWPRMKLKTVLALVAVSAVVLATIAPAFRAS